MSRRAVVAMTCAGLVAAGLPFVTGAGAAGLPAGYPTAGCFDFTDAPGDSHWLNGNNPNTDPDLDILGVALQSTAKDLKAYIKVKALSDGPSMSTDGHRYTLNFVFNGHSFAAAGSAYAHGTGAIRDGLASTGQAGGTNQLSVDSPPSATDPDAITGRATGGLGYKPSGLSFTWDKTNSFVIVDLPIADIEKYGAAKFTGKLMAVGASSAVDDYAVSQPTDSTETGNSTLAYTRVWQVGANKCWPQPKRVVKKKPKKH
jgi:hypothetical protein